MFFSGADWEDVGEVGVDSGLIWIGDPCYQGISVEKGFFDGPKPKEYTEGVCTPTGYGDGSYRVYVQRKDGRVMKIMVDFDREEEEGEN